ncbi:MAG: YkgJ family cysteine cluster protein [Thermoproteus sp.]
MPEWIGPRIRFRCLLCGECCRLYWVPVTHVDLWRIAEGTGLKPRDFAAPIPKDAVGEWGVPSILLSDGRRHYVVLKKRLDGLCIFNKLSDGRFICSIYDRRPSSCRFYPFVYIPGDVVRLELAKDAERFCPGIGRGPVRDLSAEAEAAAVREAEMDSYREVADRWNRLVASSKVGGTFDEFLEFALAAARGLKFN